MSTRLRSPFFWLACYGWMLFADKTLISTSRRVEASPSKSVLKSFKQHTKNTHPQQKRFNISTNQLTTTTEVGSGEVLFWFHFPPLTQNTGFAVEYYSDCFVPKMCWCKRAESWRLGQHHLRKGFGLVDACVPWCLSHSVWVCAIYQKTVRIAQITC